LDPTLLKVGQEVEVNITPFDQLWLPSVYDLTMGLNPAQSVNGSGIMQSDIATPQNGSPFTSGGDDVSVHVGCNVYDAFDSGIPGIDPPGQFQYAPVFSLRFNSPNNPWLLWGLGHGLAGAGWNAYINQSSGNPMGYLGSTSLMRSISGPISRMWYKLIQPAQIWSQNQGNWYTDENGIGTFAFSQVRMLCSLGYSAQVENLTASNAVPQNGAIAPPLINALMTSGYVTPQLNTLERLEAESKTGLRRLL
jgi:hypothetical protein